MFRIRMIRDQISLGDDRVLISTRRRSPNPRWALINCGLVVLLNAGVVLMVFVNTLAGLGVIYFAVGVWALLRSRVYPKYKRGELIEEITIHVPHTQDSLKLPKHI